MNKNIFSVMLILVGTLSNAQDKSLFKKHWFIQSGDTLPFRILLPKNYDDGKSYPLVLFLHGRGEIGNDNEKQLTHGASFFLADSVRKNYPAIIVFPQCATNSYWSNVHIVSENSFKDNRRFYFINNGSPSRSMKLLVSLIDHISLRYKIDPSRVYAGGLSMGAMGTFELVRRLPTTFAAAFAICGGANPATAKQIRKTGWWIFHGLKDDVVNPEFSKQMAEALKQEGAEVRLTLYPDANHNSWDSAFAEKELLPWLFSHRKK